MAKKDDIGSLLSGWPYDPDDYLREITGLDGKPKLQVRFPMGVEQYELDGRPDGLRPMGYESYLEYFIQKRERAVGSAASGGENAFRLTPEDCELLRDEAMIYYYRYDLMYMRKDYERVLRDTARNLLVFDFISHFAELVEDRESMEIYRPFALRLHFAARGLLSARKNRHEEGLRQLRSGISRIEALDDLDDPKWRRECKGAVAFLHRLERRLERTKPLSPRQRLQRDLKKAVDKEDYESAARIRDRLAGLDPSEGSAAPPCD
jgi:hypothetical protein